MEEALAKIRPHINSGLPHQKLPASLLTALESTLKEQNADPTPTAYFAILLTTLDSTITEGNLSFGEGDVLPAELYLLALVVPFVPRAVLRSHLNTLLQLTSPLFPSLEPHPPALKSQITIYQTTYLALDTPLLETPGLRPAFAFLIQLCLDARPKVRRKAVDAVTDIISSVPVPLQFHPYADRVSQWALKALHLINEDSKNVDDALHLVMLVRQTLARLPPTTLPSIMSALLKLPALGNAYLSESVYSVLSELISEASDFQSSSISFPSVLNSILSSPPGRNETKISSSWLRFLGSLVSSESASHESDAAQLEEVWNIVWSYIESEDASIRASSAGSLSCIAGSVGSRHDQAAWDIMARFTMQLKSATTALSSAPAIPELLSVATSVALAFRGRDVNNLNKVLMPLVSQIGQLRTKKGFEFKSSADAFLAAAIQVLGPELVLQALPLNLEEQSRAPGAEPRAYLLPLIKEPHPSPMSHFIRDLVPLSERLFDLQQKAEADGRVSEAKVWSVLVHQVWAAFPSYCFGPIDLCTSLTSQFSQLLSQLLYSQPELRPPIMNGLKLLVSSNMTIASGMGFVKPSPDLTAEIGKRNLEFLKTQVENWLSVFFNIFDNVEGDGRNAIGVLIHTWCLIANEKTIENAFTKVLQLLKSKLDAKVVVTAEDLLVLLQPYLSPSDATALFESCLSQPIICSKESAIQKRGYKILALLADDGKVNLDTAAVLKQLEDFSVSLLPAAKKDRFHLLTNLVNNLPPESLHIIVSLIPEAVLGTKEPSDKARAAAFDFILSLAHLMKKGGVIQRQLIEAMDVDGASEVNASIEEFMTMVAGGLAGATPHMISASVTAISRLVFEFKDDLSTTMLNEISVTLFAFLDSANREIVKSVLGFVKLAIHTLPTDLIRSHLPKLIPSLLARSHDHKNHFKVKVRHILERMLRRFGWDEVYRHAGDSEASKVLLNIKKRKERAKRRRAAREEDEDPEPSQKIKTRGDAFEDVLYGSESELADSDEEDEPTERRDRKRKIGGARLLADNESPLDLLENAALGIKSMSAKRKNVATFKTDEDTGRIIIDDLETAEQIEHPDADAYRESLTSVDGFTKNARGHVKFNKDTKKRRRNMEEIDEDVEMGSVEASRPNVKKKKTLSIGQEFKSKKAGGDVKKGNMEPYAYLPLSQATKLRGGKRQKGIGITGK